MLKYWLWYAERPGVSKVRRLELLRYFGGVEAIYLADAVALSNAPDIMPAEQAALSDKALTKAEEILAQCYALGISILTWQDAQYPPRLRTVRDAPVVLYYKGSLPEFGLVPCLAIVGARKATAFGLLTAKRFGYQLGKAGAVVVSGLADGVDAMAMVGALSAEAPVVGVLGCGADVVYPAKNRALYDDTVARGCVLTEYPPNTPPIAQHFPVRNRIISGLSDGVVVVEAAARSGSLITAELALNQGRDVFAVPGNAGSESCAGSNRLLREGALFAEHGADVLAEYAARYPALRPAQSALSLDLHPDDLRQNAAISDPHGELKVAAQIKKPKKTVDNPKKSNYIELKVLLGTTPPTQSAIVEALLDGAKSLDDIIDAVQRPTPEILVALTKLEIRQLVRKLDANRYQLAETILL